jgi:uncharacterized protein YuzE
MFSMESGCKMKIEYDQRYDLLYIRFDVTSQQVMNQRVNDNIVLDIGKDNKIVGMEILDATEVMDLSKLLPIEFINNMLEEKELAEV